MITLTEQQMRSALAHLESLLPREVTLIIGGGGAMLMAYHFPLVTSDIDGIPTAGVTLEELAPYIARVATDMSLAHDWLNPYFSTFTHVLPSDYASRLQPVMQLKKLTVLALSKDDLLIMKCFAGRMKDRTHAKALIEAGARIKFVESHLEYLEGRRIPKARAALDFLDEVQG